MAQDRQRVQDIMADNKSDSSDEEPKLDVQTTFKQFVSDKNFKQHDKHITFKDYSKINFANEMPEIVCDILYYLAKYRHPNAANISRDTYDRMIEA